VQAQPSQLIAHASRRDFVGTLAEQDGKLLAQILVGEPAGDEHEHQHRIENGLGIGIPEAQRAAGPLALDVTRALQML